MSPRNEKSLSESDMIDGITIGIAEIAQGDHALRILYVCISFPYHLANSTIHSKNVMGVGEYISILDRWAVIHCTA